MLLIVQQNVITRHLLLLEYILAEEAVEVEVEVELAYHPLNKKQIRHFTKLK
jgi:hypothetical protein